MARDVFADTSGLYALADRRDPLHPAAQEWLRRWAPQGRRLVVTDYILDEAATLAKARAGGPAAVRLLDLVEQSAVFTLTGISATRFADARAFFRKQADHGYSFTDCTSFVVMRELKLREALTSDRHFTEAGFSRLLPVV